MIVMKGGVYRARRRIEVACTAKQVTQLMRAGFRINRVVGRYGTYGGGNRNVSLYDQSGYGAARYIVMMCAEERDAFELKRGALVGAPKPAPREKSATLQRLSAAQTRVQDAATLAERVGVLLGTKEWRGSELIDYRDDTSKPCVVLRHKSGARAWLYDDHT